MALLQPLQPPRARPLTLPRSPRPPLRLLPQLATAPGEKAKPLTFAVILAGLLVAGSLVLLVINTLLAQDAFVLHRLQQKVTSLTAEEQAVTSLTERESSPESLASKATSLGMVPGETPVFLDLSTGKIVGVAQKTAVSAMAAR